MQAGSPDWISLQLQKFRTSFERHLADQALTSPSELPGRLTSDAVKKPNMILKRAFFYGLFAIAILMNTWYVKILFDQLENTSESLKIEKLYFFYPVVGLTALILTTFFKKADSIVLRVLFFSLTLSFLCLDKNFNLNIYLFIFYLILVGFSFFVFSTTQNSSLNFRRGVAFLFFAFVLSLELYLCSGWVYFEKLYQSYPQRFIFIIYLAFVNDDLPSSENKNFFSKTILFPLHLVYPLPTQPYYWQTQLAEERIRNRVKGVVDLFVCSILTVMLFKIQTSKVVFRKTDIFNILNSGLRAYLAIYLYSCVSISVPVAIGRIFGYSLPPSYYFPLLAASPQDRWRRWNTYFYNFYCWIFYIPFYKKTKSIFLSVMLTFLLTSFFHHSLGSLFGLLEDDSTLRTRYSIICFFALHGFAVYLSLISRWSVFNGQTLKGWWGVFLTWIAMIFIHSVRF